MSYLPGDADVSDTAGHLKWHYVPVCGQLNQEPRVNGIDVYIQGRCLASR